MASDATRRMLSPVIFGLVAVTYGLLVFGSAVRVHGAGLACPDWPLCFGAVVPELDFEVFLEWGHRVLAGLVSVVFLGIGVVVLADVRLRRRLGWLVGVAAALLATQVVLGGLTVLELLEEWTVASHLLTGNSFCASLLVLALLASPPPAGVATRVQRALGVVLATVVVAQLVLGGFVSSSFAGLACGTWPGCNGGPWFPMLSGPVGLQVAHRIVAYTLVVLAAAVAISTRLRGAAGRASGFVVAAVLVQATIGVANVLLRLPVEVTLLHSAGAAAVVLSTTWFNVAAWRAPLRAASRTSSAAHAMAEVG